jgi:phosphopantothenoylcysteine decarboxylase/phosphopantothenate--cysteine ligase
VSDYRPSKPARQKMKKTDREQLAVELTHSPDILTEVARLRQAGGGPKVSVGFAAETEDLLANAREKLERKGLDLIAANDVTAEGSGFAADTNQVTLLAADGSVESLPLMSKEEVAHRIWDQVSQLLQSK